ncbi:formate/nitrite transporter family protein [Alteromonas macleodii]|uniref:Transporter (Formate/nitrite transporter family protein) n=2 Tax=root TaxID=1 RepID=A0A6T9Y7T2_ALTMA|nr:formate/nitrite transporter family protein [Alteromonas macleodii]CAB9494620.1 Transporter (Formate/nitrite transporter family protein) [Alteromonas macleodii]
MTEKEKESGRREQDVALSHTEEKDVQNNQSLNSVSLYAIVHREGLEELQRPMMSLWWSGVAAGIGISLSILAEGILHHLFAGSRYQFVIENLGYTVGFVLVIVGRLQLFTENTLSVILPLLSKPSLNMGVCIARLWTIVFAANMVGTFLAAFFSYTLQAVPSELVEGMTAISEHYAKLSPSDAFSYGITSGFIIAAIVWMKPSVKHSQIWMIVIFTYLIAIGNFTHVIAGSTELFLLALQNKISVLETISLIGATLLGNIVGGTGLFALLAYGQVVREIEE